MSSPLDLARFTSVVEELLARRGGVSGLVLQRDGQLVRGASINEDEVGLTLQVAAFALEGEVHVSLPSVEDGVEQMGDVVFDSDDVRGAWEPMYRFYDELSRTLGASREEPIVEAYDADQLATDVQDVVEACLAGVLDTVELDNDEDAEDPETPTGAGTVTLVGQAPLELLAARLDFRADGVLAQVTGAGARFDVWVAGEGAIELAADERADIEASLLDDLGPVVDDHRRLRWQTSAPADDPSRAGKIVLERRNATVLEGSVVLDDLPEPLEEIERALNEADIDVIRYFGDGKPFWKASLDCESVLGEYVEAPEDLHSDRTWQYEGSI